MKQITNYKESLTYLSAIILVIVACVIVDISLFWGFLLCNLLLIALSVRQGFKQKEISKKIIDGVLECRMLYIIITLMGANIALWMSSGVIPTIVYYGFEYMQGVNYILFCFLATGFVSTIMGTGLGTLSTIGIALLGIGKGFGLPSDIMLGAIVSGAFISDKISPVSALTNLTITATNSDYKSYFKRCLPTLLTTILISSICYIIIGTLNPANINSQIIITYQEIINSTFKVTPLLLILPILVIVLAVSGISVVKNMTVIFFSGALLTILLQGASLESISQWILHGFVTDSGNDFVNSILKGGGIMPMIEVIGIVMGAIILNALLALCHVLAPLVNIIMNHTNTKSALVIKTGFISSLLTSITCDQTVGIIVPAKELRSYYDAQSLDYDYLGRTISDTGTIIAPLQFWNVNSLIIMGLTGIHTLNYAPFAILCFVSPVVTITFSYFIKSK